jgi:5-(carboxyamino)imidazole ribonucleotide synthase
VEELVPLDAELAVMVARRPSGESAAWPAVETAQVGGVCREVLVPGRLDSGVVEAASALGQKVAEIAGAVGVMAVELFWTGGRLLVNEVATRPHNSGHWTMEGAVTSQFENHVRAVLDLPLGSTAPQHPQVASVNVFGGTISGGMDGADPARLLAKGLAVEGAHVHLYGKSARPGRKLGHVTVCGDEAEEVRFRAWSAALALGTPAPDGIELPAGVLR